MPLAPRLALLLALLAAPVGAPVAAQVAAPPADGPAPTCAVTAQGEVIRVAVCDGPGSDAALAAFGEAACADVRPCGVWFWTDPAAAPATAPANHDGLTQAEVTASEGVYVAEQAMFVRIERVTP